MGRTSQAAVVVPGELSGHTVPGNAKGKGKDVGKTKGKGKGKQDVLYLWVAARGSCVCVIAYDQSIAKARALSVGQLVSLLGVSLRIAQPGCMILGMQSDIVTLDINLGRLEYQASEFYSQQGALDAVSVGRHVDLLVYIASVEAKTVQGTGESYLEVWGKDKDLMQVGPLRLWRFHSARLRYHCFVLHGASINLCDL